MWLHSLDTAWTVIAHTAGWTRFLSPVEFYCCLQVQIHSHAWRVLGTQVYQIHLEQTIIHLSMQHMMVNELFQ